MGPKCYHMYPHKKEAEGFDTVTEEEEAEWGDTATSQRMPTATGSWKRQGVDSPLEPLKGLWPGNWGMGQE